MTNGEATHEWRLRGLEDRMEKIETAARWAMYLLVSNLAGVVILLALRVVGK